MSKRSALAIIPAIFLLWDIYDLLVFRKLTLATGTLWLVGLLNGAAMGYILIKRPAALRLPGLHIGHVWVCRPGKA